MAVKIGGEIIRIALFSGMKWMYFLYAITFSMLFVACGQKDNTVQQQEQAPDTANGATWKGMINGRIPVLMHLQQETDSVITGELIYLNTKKRLPIGIIGYSSSDTGNTVLTELLPDGTISGNWFGKPDTKTFTGIWEGNGKSLEFSLTRTDTVWQDTRPINKSIDGTYRYAYPDDGPAGEFAIKRLGKQQVLFAISCHTGAPSFNTAQLPTDTLRINADNQIIYNHKDDTWQCAFTINIYRSGLAVVAYKVGCEDCGFGLNATVDGNYIKTSDSTDLIDNQ